MARIAHRAARRPSETTEAAPAIVPTKQLSVSTFRAANPALPNVLSTEIGDRVAYFSGGGGTAQIYATTDGKKLHRRQAPQARGLRGIKVIADELWVTGEYGTVAVSGDRGASWTELDTPNGACLWDVARDARGAFWIGGSGQTILKASRRGAAFKLVAHTMKARDDRADPRVEIVPAGVMFPLFNAYWNGKQFVKPKGLKGAMCALAIAPSGTIVIVGDDGAAFRSTDGGVSYKAVATGVKVHLEDVAVVAGGFVAVGDKGTLRRSEDDGVTWKPLASGSKAHLWSIGSWGAGAFVGGDDGLVLRIESPGDTYWRGAADDFAPKPIVAAAITALRGPSEAEREARFAKLFAEAVAAHAPLANKLASPKHPIDDHAKAILAALDDVDEYKVLGDVLQAAGDPRGELIALQAAGQDKAAAKHLKKHRAALLGGLAELDKSALKLEWRYGFIHAARVAYESEDLDIDYDEETDAEVTKWIATLLDEPAARFLQELTVGIVQQIDNSYDNVMREIGRRARPALRKLYLGDFDSEQTEISWSHLGDATKLCGACDRLEHLTLRSGSMNLGKPGQLVFPHLRELAIVTGGLAKEHLRAIVAAHLPSLESLTLYFGTDRYGCNIKRKDLASLLDSPRFPRLRHLGLVNSEFADELCGVLHLSPLVAQVRELDLSMGTLSDLGVRALATYAKGLAHLEKLDLSQSFVSPSAIKQLAKALPNTEIASERQRGGEFDRRYVSVSE
jgi:photosystem II stability/assembly factor-like uncharacterized protein